LDLPYIARPLFTQWVVARGLLGSPFVVIDVGCYGGAHPRWAALGDQLVLHGFDAQAEAVEALASRHGGPGRHRYHAIALGNEDGEREFFVQQNPTASSFYGVGDQSRLAIDPSVTTRAGRRVVPIRKLDSLFAEGRIPPADVIKLDCEGFEPEVLRGAQAYLAASRPVGVETETGFSVSPILPDSHFAGVYEQLVAHHLLLFDLVFDRHLRSSYLASRPDFGSSGQPGTFQVLFARDVVGERAQPHHYKTWPRNEAIERDTVVKSAIVLELYGLCDCAYEVVTRYADLLGPVVDVEHAGRLLRDSDAGRDPVQAANAPLRRVIPAGSALYQGGSPDRLRTELLAVYESRSWRWTAPLRALRRLIPG
jgi:FkbM family methyltransferase